MKEIVDVITFLNYSGTLFDIRTPSEYAKGHIPGAISLPLIADKTKQEIEEIYQQAHPELAIEQALKIIGPYLADIVRSFRMQKQHTYVKIYGERGGLRSASISALLRLAGIPTVVLSGGYLAFRKWVCQSFELDWNFLCLGGYAGTPKTTILRYLQKKQVTILDLKKLAYPNKQKALPTSTDKQPTSQFFENSLAIQLFHLRSQPVIWVEETGRFLGNCQLPYQLFHKILQAPLILVELTKLKRTQQFMKQYNSLSRHVVIKEIENSFSKLHMDQKKEVISLLRKGNLQHAVEKLLHYEDVFYKNLLQKQKRRIYSLKGKKFSSNMWADALKQKTKEILSS